MSEDMLAPDRLLLFLAYASGFHSVETVSVRSTNINRLLRLTLSAPPQPKKTIIYSNG